MRVILLQTDICWADSAANVARLGKVIDHYDKVDLFVFPEMFSTGFALCRKVLRNRWTVLPCNG